MPTIRRAQTPDVAPAGQGVRGLSSSLASNQAAGSNALASGLNDVSGTLGQFALRSADVKNQADLVRAKLTIKQAEAEIQQHILTNSDRNTWGDAAQSAIDKVHASVLDQDLSPVVRRQLDAELSGWQQNTLATVDNQRQRAENSENDQVIEQAMVEAYGQGNTEEGDKYADMRSELGLQLPGVMEAAKRRGHTASDVAQFNASLAADSQSTLAAIDDKTPTGRYRQFTNVTEDQRMAMRREAETRVNADRAETVQNLWSRMDSGEFIPKQDLDDLVDEGKLKSTQAHDLMGAQTRIGLNPDANEAFALALQAASAYNPAEDATGKRYSEILGFMAGLPREWRDQVRSKLSERKQGGSKTNLGESHLGRLFSSGLFGDSQFDAQGASTKYTDAMQRFLSWAQDHPGSTPNEQVAFINDMVREDTTDATDIVNGLSGQAP